MEPLNIKETDSSPAIKFDPENEIFEIVGRSLLENPVAFFQSIFDWFDSYAKKPNKQTNLVFKLEYFNTASSKTLLILFSKLENIHKNNPNVQVTWYYPEFDEDMKEQGEDLANKFDIPFNFKVYKVSKNY